MSESAFERVVKARRGYFNARFAEQQLAHRGLDGDAFLGVLRDYVAPVVEAVAQATPDVTMLAGQHLYDLALDLYAQGMLGQAQNGTNAAALPVITKVWEQVLPSLAISIAEAPQRVTASVINAAYNIAQTPGARPEQWLESMRFVAPLCGDADTCLRAGQVAAWRAGMAHYRLGALDILKTLDAHLARGLFGLDPKASQPDTDALHDALVANPWYDPAAQSDNARQIRIVKRVGAFRGFGGMFITPPRVMWTREGFVATDGTENYLVTADAFGATLHRAGEIQEVKSSSPFKLNRDGGVSFKNTTAKFPELANATSSAANENTLAVTTGLTHAIYLLTARAAFD